MYTNTVNITDYNLSSSLSLLSAVIYNRPIEELEKYIRYGADPNYERHGRPIIDHAVEHCSLEIIQFLVKNGANVYGCDYALWTAVGIGKTDILDYLLQITNYDIITDTKYLLFISVGYKQFDNFKLLLNRGAQISRNKLLNNEDLLTFAKKTKAPDIFIKYIESVYNNGPD